MDRRILLSLAALAAILGTVGTPAVLADRLGGNYRGPDGNYIARSDEAASNPGGGDSGGSSGGSSSGGDTGGGDSGGGDGGDSGSPESGPESGGGGGGEGGGGEGGGGEGGGGEGGGGEGEGGGSSGPESGGGGPESGGGGGGGDSGGGSAPAPGGGSAPSGPSGPSSGGGGGDAKTGKGKAQEDKDRIWPFYVESAKEEYIAALLARRATARISNPKTSTFALSPQPEPGRERRLVLETDRQEARDLVLGLLKDKDSHVRDAAVLALGKSGYKDAIPLIQNAAETDTDPAVREDALLALGLSGQKDAALPALLKALNSAGSDKRAKRAAYAALGLGLLGEPQGAVEPLRSLYQTAVGRADQTDEAACAAVALAMLGDAGSLEIFGKVLAARSASDQVKCYTLHALGKFGSHPDEKVRADALKLLILGLGMKKKEMKQSAILALGSYGETRAIQALVKDGLGDSDNYCKNFAAHALGRIAGRFGPATNEYRLVAKELAKVTENENQDKWLFQAGNVALASMAYSDQEKALLEHCENLGKMNLHSASAVVVALGMLGSESPAVSKRLQEAFEARGATNIQAYAGLALAMSRSPGAADNLGKLLKGDSRPHADVARTAALALGLVGGAKDADILVECIKGSAGGQSADSAKFFLMGASVQGLGLIADGDTVKKLKPLLASTEWQQRAFACAALGYILEEKAENRVSPRISGIFRHHNYHLSLPVVKAVQSTL